MMPVELTGNLFKELRGRVCRILSEEGWTQAKLCKILGVSQVMAGNYLHTLPSAYSEPIESDLQESARSLAELLKGGDSSKWHLKLVIDDQELVIRFPVQDNREKTLENLSSMRKRLSNIIPLLSPQVRVNIAIAESGAEDSSGIAAFPGRLTPIAGQARPLSSPKFGSSSHLSSLLLEIRKYNPDSSVIINLRWDSVISDVADKIKLKFIKLERSGDNLIIDSKVSEVKALVDEGGHGFEPSLYIFGDNPDSVSGLVEDLAKSVEAMA